MFRILIAMAFIGSLLMTAPARAEQVTLINVFEVPEGSVDAAVKYWEASRDILARQPGYISTRLHQALLPNARFQLINVAQWESVDAFEAATARMRMESRAKPPAGLKANPALFQVVRE
ncbi:MAG TPA: antibiotic biosynthesis monooxygenase family protein [Sinorhizobium sp.]|nr:antibiotic biosynthesis monooxygenase family protein [Sinorhizobium sp.]